MRDAPVLDGDGPVASRRMLRTVLGDIPADHMGVTLPHEHIFTDTSVWFREPEDRVGRWYAERKPTLDTLWWHRQHPNSSRPVLQLTDEDTAVAELAVFAEAGGSTVIDLTTRQMGRNPLGLVRVSADTGLHVVAATGHYVGAVHEAGIVEAGVDVVAAGMVDEVLIGIDGTGVKAGVIGEIGVSWPVLPSERVVLRAAALAQRLTGAVITVHTAAHAVDQDSALVAADELERAGADLTRVVMAHMDTTLHRPDYHRAVADRGCHLEYDLFGHEFFESENGFQSFGDTETARAVVQRVEEGYGDRLLLSQDICYLLQLQRYGGYGYAHLLRNILPRLELWGLDRASAVGLLTTNPQRLFPLCPVRPPTPAR